MCLHKRTVTNVLLDYHVICTKKMDFFNKPGNTVKEPVLSCGRDSSHIKSGCFPFFPLSVQPGQKRFFFKTTFIQFF